MKRFTTLLSATLIMAGNIYGGEEDYVRTLYQSFGDNPLGYSVPNVDSTETGFVSPSTIGEEGATFSVYAAYTHTENGQAPITFEYLVDELYVGSLVADIEITDTDMSNAQIPRIRADQQFSVGTSARGFVEGSGPQLSDLEIRWQGQSLPDGLEGFSGIDDLPYASTVPMNGMDVPSQHSFSTRLAGGEHALGVETFFIYADVLNAEGQPVGKQVISSASVQVLPVATADFSDLEESAQEVTSGNIYRIQAGESVTINTLNTYPGSVTQIRAYRAGVTPPLIDSSPLPAAGNENHSFQVIRSKQNTTDDPWMYSETIPDFTEYFEGSETQMVAVYTKTVFEGEVQFRLVDMAPVQVIRELKVRARVTTQ